MEPVALEQVAQILVARHLTVTRPPMLELLHANVDEERADDR
eukprot:CAMPEP_0119135876 /NCGR_PEP_ID=MMETSP1310-20130426/20235_1 /TAXON_ID=464262 /ORGANISM="Genus nov. species nov., Strain RCC2339" /LENGTH=41 /DNA_ID= /DNA_START= /DNA_END= /DNA_ORIENTATION=